MTYSSSIAMNRSRYASSQQKTINLSNVKVGAILPVSNTILLIMLACLLGFLYLAQVTKTNGYGYQINSLQQKQAALMTQETNLQIASAQLQSVQRVQNSSVAKSMVPVAPSATIH